MPELPIAMLACARIGAPHSVVFGGFSADSLRDRINDAEAKILITADGGWRRGQVVPLKANADEAVKDCPGIEHVVTLRRCGNEHPFTEGRDIWYHDWSPTSPTSASPRRWTRRTSCISSTRAAPRGRRRASRARRAAT